jgi:hypothetical protein
VGFEGNRKGGIDMEIRLLQANEIDVRVQSVKKTSKGVGCILLLYKDARVDMKILDEVYGPNGWQRTHEVINDNLFCNVDTWDNEKKCWIRKHDVGVESNTEKQKGEASDAFKRACFNVGIGRELYTAPFIWIDLKDGEYTESNGKLQVSTFAKFSVKSIGYNKEREIISLEIIDSKNTSRYKLGTQVVNNLKEEKPEVNQPAPKAPAQPANNATGDILKCRDCSKPIPKTVHDFSVKKYGTQLCIDCQKKHALQEVS